MAQLTMSKTEGIIFPPQSRSGESTLLRDWCFPHPTLQSPHLPNLQFIIPAPILHPVPHQYVVIILRSFSNLSVSLHIFHLLSYSPFFSHPRGHWVLYILPPMYLLKSVPSFVFLVPLNFCFSIPLTWSRVMCHLDVILLPPKLSFEWRSNSLTYYSRPFIHFSLPSPQTYFSAGPFIL